MTKKENDKLIKGVYDGEYDESNLPEFVFLFTFSELIKEVDKGYGKIKSFPDRSKEQRKAAKFRTNINVFSGAKTWQEVHDLSQAVFMPDGQRMPFSDYSKIAKGINDTYNKAWLKAEQNTALSQSQGASFWDDIEDDKEDLPLLKYVTVGDERVRPKHAAWDGIILPVDNPWWNTHMPPNDWNDRCTVQQLAEGKKTNLKQHLKDYNKSVPNEKKVKTLRNDSKLFANNPGKDEFIFDPSVHPYFKNIPKQDKKNNFGFGFQ